MMSSVYSSEERYEIFTKGAVESVLPISNYILDNGVERPLSAEDRISIMAKNNEFADQAMSISFCLQKSKTKS